MVKDILIDIESADVVLADATSQSVPTFESHWDCDTLEVLIPYGYRNILEYINDTLEIKFSASYNGLYRNAKIKIIKLLDDGSKETFATASLYQNAFNGEKQLNVSQLFMVDGDGIFKVLLTRGNDKAYLYSGQQKDFLTGPSDNQSVQLLAMCDAGKNYRYPTSGIGITKYIGAVIIHSDLASKIQNQYQADGRYIQNANFDNETCTLDLDFTPEVEEEDTNILPVDELVDLEWLREMTDDKIKEVLGL